MKNTIYKYIVCIGLIAASVSCESLLDLEPTTSYSYNNFWNEPTQVSAALNGAYQRLQTALNTEFIIYGESRSDNLDSKLYNASTYSLSENTLSPDYTYADWSYFYRVVNQANLIIRNVQIMKEKGLYMNKDSEYNRVLGQALGLRALSYLYMVKVWGDVPLMTEPSEYNGNINAFKKPRTDKSLIYDLISSDLNTAYNLLPNTYSDSQKDRANLTRGGICAIAADYYMWKNDLDSALLMSGRVLNNTKYKLVSLYDTNRDYLSLNQTEIDNTEYARMFIEGFAEESIFEIAFNYDEGSPSGLASYFGAGAGVVFYYASPNLTSIFPPGDLRARISFKNETQIFKMFPKGSYDRITENDKNVILYRLADIMLLRAEVLTLKGNRNDAWNLLKNIRERAFGKASATNNNNNDVSGPTGSQTEADFKALTIEKAHEVILEERRKELCFEGKRWFDLVRTGKAISTMQPINGIYDTENILFPIGRDVIRQNPEIEQNNYYK